MGFLDKLAKALNEANRASQVSGKLSFQEQQSSPELDKLNRVIVKVEGGSDIVLGVNEQSIEVAVGEYLLGTSEPYEDVEDRKVKVLISKDLESPYANSVKVETTNCEAIGWILKADSPIAIKVIDSLTSQINSVAPELKDLVFEVEAIVNGAFDEDEDESGKTVLIPDFSLEIGIKDPAEIDVLAAKKS